MTVSRLDPEAKQRLQDSILLEKANGTPDIEIGRKYGVTYRYIERLITKTHGINISALNGSKSMKSFHPENFKEEQTTVWSFKQRGNWATHSGEYRGNWSPYIPRNIILKYSKPGELVLDCFCGAGTTAVEAKLLGRKCIALDINDKAIELARGNTAFEVPAYQLPLSSEQDTPRIYEPQLLVGDARDLTFLKSSSIDLICTHPPYANIIQYTDTKTGDLSFYDVDVFLNEMSSVARECYRVLKPGRQCAVLIGDTRRQKHVVPLGFKLIDVFLKAGFELRELVIKRQHNCKTTGFWYTNSVKYNFLLLAHEYLPIFQKPVLPALPIVKETATPSRLVLPKKARLRKTPHFKDFETTTVWVLPEDRFDEQLNSNVVARYGEGKDASTIAFMTADSDRTTKKGLSSPKNKHLLFAKSPLLKTEPSRYDIHQYLKAIAELADFASSTLQPGGFLVIQTEDVRIDNYLEPLAKRIVEVTATSNLWLKEIVALVRNGHTSDKQNETVTYLDKIHEYLLVYEQIQGGSTHISTNGDS